MSKYCILDVFIKLIFLHWNVVKSYRNDIYWRFCEYILCSPFLNLAIESKSSVWKAWKGKAKPFKALNVFCYAGNFMTFYPHLVRCANATKWALLYMRKCVFYEHLNSVIPTKFHAVFVNHITETNTKSVLKIYTCMCMAKKYALLFTDLKSWHKGFLFVENILKLCKLAIQINPNKNGTHFSVKLNYMKYLKDHFTPAQCNNCVTMQT